MRIRALSGDLAQFRFSIFSHFFEQVKKMAEISDLDWAQHIKMDYAQILRKNPAKTKKWTIVRARRERLATGSAGGRSFPPWL